MTEVTTIPSREKRRKRVEELQVNSQKPIASRIFTPFRSIGFVANHVPFDVQIRGQQFLLTTCVGKATQTYDCAKMNLLFVSSETEHPITAIVSLRNFLLVASGPHIIAMKRGKEIWRLTTDQKDHITHLLAFGSYICATTTKNQLLVYDLNTLELHIHITLSIQGDVTCLLHPPTYLNKLVVGDSEGRLQIWNIRTGSIIHRTESFGHPITTITASPVVDVIAVGLLDGTIIVHHLKADQNIVVLHQEGRVSSISFRKDGFQIMASANSTGDIAMWDLEKGKVLHVLRSAHTANIPSIHFLNGQPLLLSAGVDNSIKEWIFDSLDGIPRLLRSRSGHHAPPTTIGFYGPTSHFILSASRDRSLRGFSTWNDSQTAELSQGSIQSIAKKKHLKENDLRLPEITGIASQTTREKDWDNVLTMHKDDVAVRAWTWSKRRIGQHIFRTLDKSPVKSVAISGCGNFGLIGSAKGTADVYNMQSGIHRRTFSSKTAGHTKAISGIDVDPLNKTLITSSLDWTVKFWDFAKGTLLDTINVGSGITLFKYNRGSELLALACDDLSIKILDTETKKLVRELWGHDNRITSFAFSNDARWLVSAGLDSTIRTWDLPTGHLIDAIRTPATCTALAFSPTGDYLATTHIDSVGIHLWTNKSQFVQISTRHVTEAEIQEIVMPTASGEGGMGIIEAALGDLEDTKDVDICSFNTVEQLADDLLTLSVVPKSRWQNLLNLDIIRQRNKPKAPPKAPEKAPFDLGTLRDLKKGGEQKTTGIVDESASRFLKMDGVSINSEFTNLLRQGGESNDCELDEYGSSEANILDAAFIEHMKGLGASSIDLQINSLSLIDNFQELIYYISAMTQRLEKRRDYDVVQAWMATFLRAHSDVIAENIDQEELEMALIRWKAIQEKEGKRLADLVGYCNGVVRFITSR